MGSGSSVFDRLRDDWGINLGGKMLRLRYKVSSAERKNGSTSRTEPSFFSPFFRWYVGRFGVSFFFFEQVFKWAFPRLIILGPWKRKPFTRNTHRHSELILLITVACGIERQTKRIIGTCSAAVAKFPLNDDRCWSSEGCCGVRSNQSEPGLA